MLLGLPWLSMSFRRCRFCRGFFVEPALKERCYDGLNGCPFFLGFYLRSLSEVYRRANGDWDGWSRFSHERFLMLVDFISS